MSVLADRLFYAMDNGIFVSVVEEGQETEILEVPMPFVKDEDIQRRVDQVLASLAELWQIREIPKEMIETVVDEYPEYLEKGEIGYVVNSPISQSHMKAIFDKLVKGDRYVARLPLVISATEDDVDYMNSVLGGSAKLLYLNCGDTSYITL